MRAKSMLLLLIALGCGLVASIGISQVLDKSGTVTVAEAPTAEIFVAAADINISDKFDASNVKLEKWPLDKVPEGALSDLAEVEGRFAAQRMYIGEPIVKQKLLDSDNSEATKIPDGYRATAIKVSMDTAVANLLRPGDRVDVIGFFRKSSDVPETSTRTILRSVRVFSVNSETTRERNQNGETMTLTTVSLLVKEDQVEQLLLADELGEIRLSLRRPDDNADDDTGGMATTTALFRGEAGIAEDRAAVAAMSPEKPVAPPEPASTPPANNLLSLLQAAHSLNPAPPTPEEPKFKMMVHTPDGVEEFQWRDRNRLPEQVTASVPTQAPPVTANPHGL